MADTRGKILIVDDIELNRAILKEAFQDEFEVIEAENGLECLDRIRKYKNEF